MFRNTFYILLEKAVKFIYAFVLIPIVANHIGTEAFSIYVSAISQAALLSFFYNLGLDKAQLSGYYNYLGFRSIINARIVGFLIYSVINIIYFTCFSYSDSKLLSLIMVLLIGFRFTQTYDIKWHSELQSKTNTIIKVVSLVTLFVLVYLEIIFSFSSSIIILTLTLESVIVLIINVVKLELNWFRVSIRDFLDVVIAARYFVIANLASLIYLKSDVLIVKNRFGAVDAAQYGAMLRLVEPLTAVAMAFSTVIIARNVKNNELFSFRPIIFITLLGLLVSISLSQYSEEIVALVYSKDYRSSAQLLRWYSWTIVFVFIKNLSWSLFIEKGLIKVVTLSNIISALIYVSLAEIFDYIRTPLDMAKITLTVYSISAVIAPLLLYKFIKKHETSNKKIIHSS